MTHSMWQIDRIAKPTAVLRWIATGNGYQLRLVLPAKGETVPARLVQQQGLNLLGIQHAVVEFAENKTEDAMQRVIRVPEMDRSGNPTGKDLMLRAIGTGDNHIKYMEVIAVPEEEVDRLYRMFGYIAADNWGDPVASQRAVSDAKYHDPIGWRWK